MVWRNLKLGLLFLAVFLLGALLRGSAESAPKPAPPPTFNGRYQMFFSPLARTDAYLVDTQTGKIWSGVRYTFLEDEPRIWAPEYRVDNKAELDLWVSVQPRKEKP